MRILVVGSPGCGKYTAIRRMMPTITTYNYRNYANIQQDTYILEIRGVVVSVVDLAENASIENFVKACSDIDGAIVFVGQPEQKFGETIGKVAPLAKIRYINYNGIELADVNMPRINLPYGDSLQSHVEELIDSIRAPKPDPPPVQVPVKAEPSAPSEMWLLFTGDDPKGEECHAYDTIEDAHAAITERFVFPVVYRGAQYYGFEAEKNNYILLTSSAACVAAIIQRSIVRVGSGTLYVG